MRWSAIITSNKVFLQMPSSKSHFRPINHKRFAWPELDVRAVRTTQPRKFAGRTLRPKFWVTIFTRTRIFDYFRIKYVKLDYNLRQRWRSTDLYLEQRRSTVRNENRIDTKFKDHFASFSVTWTIIPSIDILSHSVRLIVDAMMHDSRANGKNSVTRMPMVVSYGICRGWS